MTRLLVSVRDEAEARAAAWAGADFIDAKDPAEGALGALAPARIARPRPSMRCCARSRPAARPSSRFCWPMRASIRRSSPRRCAPGRFPP